MTIAEFKPNSRGDQLKTVLRRVSGRPVEVARTGVSMLVERWPQTLSATQAGARATTTALQRLPDSTLRSLLASSVGLGAGLYLSGRRRLVVAAGVAPAVVMGAAMALRPVKPAISMGEAK